MANSTPYNVLLSFVLTEGWLRLITKTTSCGQFMYVALRGKLWLSLSEEDSHCSTTKNELETFNSKFLALLRQCLPTMPASIGADLALLAGPLGWLLLQDQLSTDLLIPMVCSPEGSTPALKGDSAQLSKGAPCFLATPSSVSVSQIFIKFLQFAQYCISC